MTIGGHELALTIINDGKGYQRRRELGEYLYHGNRSGIAARAEAQEWITIARQGALQYDKEFGSAGASSFTVHDILCAAVELAEYYEEHARDSANVAA